MTSDPLADSRDKVVEVSGFVAINIVRVSSREVGEVGGEVGVDGEPEEEGDDCQGGPDDCLFPRLHHGECKSALEFSGPFPEFSSDAWGRSRGVERFVGVCGGHGGWGQAGGGQAGGEGMERDGRKEGRKEGRGQCNNLSDTRHASNALAAARHSGCLTLVFASLVPRSSRRDKTWTPSCVRPR